MNTDNETTRLAASHVKQSVNGCVLCPRKWSDHTAEERGVTIATPPAPSREPGLLRVRGYLDAIETIADTALDGQTQLSPGSVIGYVRQARAALDRAVEPGLREFSEALDGAVQAALPARSVADKVWQDRNDRWVPLSAVESVATGLPCPMRSSVTDQPCVLSWGHPADSGTRFHKFDPPGAALDRVDEGADGLDARTRRLVDALTDDRYIDSLPTAVRQALDAFLPTADDVRGIYAVTPTAATCTVAGCGEPESEDVHQKPWGHPFATPIVSPDMGTERCPSCGVFVGGWRGHLPGCLAEPSDTSEALRARVAALPVVKRVPATYPTANGDYIAELLDRDVVLAVLSTSADSAEPPDG